MSAVPLSDDRPIDPDDECLVAYLDGELEAQERGLLEQRLLENPSLRVRLQELQQSWDWLEQLPSTTPSERMVESTLALVVSDVMQATSNRPAWHQRWRTPLLLIAALLVPPLLAWGAVKFQRDLDYERQLRDLAIAENVEAYLEANDLSLIRELASHTQWNQMIRAAREVGLIPLDTTAIVADVPVEQREEKLRDLTIDQRASLAARWDRFSQLPLETKSQVRRMHGIVRQQTDADSLVKTMKDYAAWKETLRPQLTDQIEGRFVDPGDPQADRDRQQEALDRAISQTVRELTSRSGTSLDDETTSSIYRVLEHIVIMRQALDDRGTVKLVEYLRTRFSETGAVLREDPEKIAVRAAIPYILRADGTPPRLFSGPRDLPPLSPLTTEELEWIEVVLARQDQDWLDLIAGSNQEFRMMYLQAWAEEASERNSFYPRRRSDESLRERYLALPEDHRSRIDLDDPEKLSQHLSRETSPRGRPPRSSNGNRSSGEDRPAR